MKPQILFVDDEPSVLAGLRRLMRRRTGDWDVHLVESAEEAMDLLARQPIDVLVTDMRMPGTDGVALLEHALAHHPATARVVLSGHADRQAILTAAGPTQQFLTKPCDPDHLDDVLASVVSTVHLMDDPHLRAIMGAQDRLPKPPGIYAELIALAETPGTTARDIASVMEKDLACAAEVLKLVNSSFFGLAKQVTTIDRAVTLLGLNIVRSLVLAGTLFTSGPPLPDGLDPREVSDHGLQASLRARRIAALENWDPATTEQLALAALLHDLGLLVLAGTDPAAWQHYRRLRSTGPLPGGAGSDAGDAGSDQSDAGSDQGDAGDHADGPATTPDRDHQQAAFGTTTGRATSYLLGLWGFAPGIITALAGQPLDLTDPRTHATATPAEILIAYAHQDDPATLHAHLPATTGAYLDPDRATRWAATC